MTAKNRAIGEKDQPGERQGIALRGELVPAQPRRELTVDAGALCLHPLVQRAGVAAVFAVEEFFFGTIRNEHTRRAYLHAVRRFLSWADTRTRELAHITPRDVGQYLDSLGKTTSIATRKQHLAALRHFFDGMVTRHAILLNPALSVRGERYAVVEGKTPEITVVHARILLASINTAQLVGLRDRALLAILIYTASRAGAVATQARQPLQGRGAVDAALR